MRKFQKFFLHGGRQWSLIMERSCVSSLPAADYCLRSAARRLISLIALALKLDEDYFVKPSYRALPDSRCFIVNIGDMMERWTNCLFRSTLHRVMPTGQERYSMAFFMDPNPDCIVECLESCCSESCPPRFPAIRSGDYFTERFRLTYD
ncbi:unnamed protein product [Linum tenue]|uniref:4Fe-4S ferredoxin-type domain-containing protein n=1 Tax=Linum tenue TaxID=586396 RepID=A0AAV0K7L0_9ROSI|nr:unnamed protein product [Linum tenue]